MGKEDLMTYAGIDLRKCELVVAVENERGSGGQGAATALSG